MSYYGGTIELESAEWNDKKAVEHELAQATWGGVACYRTVLFF